MYFIVVILIFLKWEINNELKFISKYSDSLTMVMTYCFEEFEVRVIVSTQAI
jgi:hypothetical protein